MLVNTSRAHCGVDDYCLIINKIFKKTDIEFVHLGVKNSSYKKQVLKNKLSWQGISKNAIITFLLFPFLLIKHKADIVHINTADDFYLLFWRLFFKKKKWLITRHNSFPLNIIMHKSVFFLCHKIICISKYSREIITKPLKKNKDGKKYSKVVTIYNTVMKHGSSKRIRQETNNTFIIGFLGRIDPQKGLDILIDAFKLLKNFGKKNNKKILLLFAGEYSTKQFKQQILSQIKGEARIHHLGFLETSDEINDFYNTIDFLVQPSRLSFKETFGLTVINALQHEKPIVAFNSGALKEIISPPLGGIVIEKQSAKELAKGLKSMLKQLFVKRNLYQKTTRELYRKKYDNNIFFDKLSKVYHHAYHEKVIKKLL